MKFAAIADLHLGNHRRFGGELLAGRNARYKITLDVLARVCTATQARGYQHLFILGDVFDVSRPTPAELYGLMTTLKQFRDLTFHLLVGNHDMQEPREHALQCCAYLENVNVVDTPTTRWGVTMVPFFNGPAEVHLPEILAGYTGQAHTLMLHMGISDTTTPAYLRGSHDSIGVRQLLELMQEHGYRECYAGNWHNHKVWQEDGCRITQCGAASPTGFDNQGALYGTICFSDGSVERVPGPRFYKAAFEDFHASALAEMREEGDSIFLSLVANPVYIAAAKARLRELVAEGLITGGEVKVNREVVTAVARSAARAAIKAENVDEAVREYVKRAAMPDGADRAEVLSLVRGYLGKSGAGA